MAKVFLQWILFLYCFRIARFTHVWHPTFSPIREFAPFLTGFDMLVCDIAECEITWQPFSSALPPFLQHTFCDSAFSLEIYKNSNQSLNFKFFQSLILFIGSSIKLKHKLLILFIGNSIKRKHKLLILSIENSINLKRVYWFYL